MTVPSPKVLKQWLPWVGSAAFTMWVLLLVALSLFPAGKEAVPGRETKHMPTMPAPVSPQECVTMPDGLLICDDVNQGRQQ